MKTDYTVFLLSNDGSYSHFPGITHDWLHKNQISYPNGTVVLESCAGARYDMQIRQNGSPVSAISTNEAGFFLKAAIVLAYLRDEI